MLFALTVFACAPAGRDAHHPDPAGPVTTPTPPPPTDTAPGTTTPETTTSGPVTTPSLPCTDTDGDTVPDAAEAALGTDPAVFDGGCLAWPATVSVAPDPVEENDFVLGDLDGDGDLDALSTAEWTTLYWHENTGSAQFGPLQILALDGYDYYGTWLPLGASGLAIADLDGDGHADALYTLDGDADQISVALGEGGGAFGSATLLAAGAIYTSSLEAVDLDADGDVDLLGAVGFHEAGWWENEGGALTPHTIEARDWVRTAAGDLDGDGDPDIAFGTSNDTGDVGWYENLGGATAFAVHVLTAFEAPATAIALGDVDRDGDLDLAESRTTHNASFWENLGGGQFAPETPLGNCDQVSMADVDLDGDADLVGTRFSQLTWWSHEAGAFAFHAVGAATYATGIRVGDLDGDGHPDAASPPGLTWYRNPLGDDTDGDGITDDAEACVLGTDPTLADTDADGSDDAIEACAPTDPLDASAHP
jgi:hypothetical protein